jgi:hypothetical protein
VAKPRGRQSHFFGPQAASAPAVTEEEGATLKSVAFIALVESIVPAGTGSMLAIGGGSNLNNVTTLTGAGALGNTAAASAANVVDIAVEAVLPLLRLREASVWALALPSANQPVSPVPWRVRAERP